MNKCGRCRKNFREGLKRRLFTGPKTPEFNIRFPCPGDYGLFRLCENTFQKPTALQFSMEARMFKVYNVVTDPVHQRTLTL
tara:strand:+ start:791 stop:1033 length:243 start_codon:yes stop_codon:yes gene_type:complete